MRFRKRVKVFPGFYLNFSNSGVTSTVGIKGASVNFSKKGTYLNTGIPGTGIYDRQKIGGNQTHPSSFKPVSITFENDTDYFEVLTGEIKSADQEQLTSSGLIEIKETLEEVYHDRIELSNEILLMKNKIKSAKIIYIISRVFIIGFFIKAIKNNVTERKEYLLDIENQLEKAFVNIDVYFDRDFEKKYNVVLDSYKSLLTTEVIWDITSAVHQDMKLTRSAASTVVTRQKVKFKFENINIIKSSYPAFHFENKNGGDLYVYPAFIITTTNRKEFALIDIKEFELTFLEQRFLEEEKVPSDTKVIDKTWAKVNKNGSPDKRFKDNYQIPIVRYGEFILRSESGLNESYSFSNYEKAHDFAESFKIYQNQL